MEKWSEVLERFHHVTDKLGMPIDEGIFETVVALNMLGIKTHQSCEGHFERGLPYPWIDFETPEYRLLWQDDDPEIKELQARFTEARKRIKDTETSEMRELKRAARQTALRERYLLHQLLSQFYKDRQTSFDRIITLSSSFRIRSQGGDFLELLSLDERAQKLQEYQDEMAAFTAFLKSRISPELMS